MVTGHDVSPIRAPDLYLRAVLEGLPRTAAGLHTLVTVGPEARQPLFRHVSEAAADMDVARAAVMATVKDLPQERRGTAIRIAQTASLLGSLMVAVSRVAAQGRPGPLPPECRQRARKIVELADRALLTLPRPRTPMGTVDPDPAVLELDDAVVLPLLTAMSIQLDRLMVVLTGESAHRSSGG